MASLHRAVNQALFGAAVAATGFILEAPNAVVPAPVLLVPELEELHQGDQPLAAPAVPNQLQKVFDTLFGISVLPFRDLPSAATTSR